MPRIEPKWPRKTREFHNHHFDSTVWNDFRFRDDDIIIATYAKTGTTWTQQIVAQLLFADADDLPVADMSPWLDLRVPPNDGEARGAGGADAPPLYQDASAARRARLSRRKAKYIYIAPRRPRRGVEHVQPSRQRERAVVPGAQRHARPGRAADREAARHRSGSISSTGWTATAIRSGRSGRTFAGWWASPRPAELDARCISSELQGRHAAARCAASPPFSTSRSTRRGSRRWSSIAAFAWMKANATKSTPLGGAIWDAAVPRSSSTRAPTAAGATC